VPLIEAQACGIPVITTQGSAMNENAGPGRVVGGQRFWNPVHRAWWTRPNGNEIVDAYYDAYRASEEETTLTSRAACAFAQDFEAAVVAEKYWRPLLERLEPKQTKDEVS
jgi:glycosyltransferase involved in cell wall biosynthesis